MKRDDELNSLISYIEGASKVSERQIDILKRKNVEISVNITLDETQFKRQISILNNRWRFISKKGAFVEIFDAELIDKATSCSFLGFEDVSVSFLSKKKVMPVYLLDTGLKYYYYRSEFDVLD